MATFIIWILAKNRLNQYWGLATTSAVDAAGASNGGDGSGISMFPSLPSLDDIWKNLTGQDAVNNGGQGW